MQLLSGFFNVIVLMGALQGAIISILLFTSKKRPNRFLGFLIFFIALASFKIWLNNQQWYYTNTFFSFFDAVVPMIIVMPVGPLLYFYSRSVLHPNFTFFKRDRIHFYPVVIDILPAIVAIGYIIGTTTGLFKTNTLTISGFLDTYNIYSDIPRWISLTVYLIYSFRYIKHNAKDVQPDKLKWLGQCLMAFTAFQVIWLIYLIPYVTPAFTDKILKTVNWYPIYLPLTVLIYWLGIKGYSIRYREQKNESIVQALSEDTIEKTITSLKNAMEQNSLYLNPKLNLNSFSQEINIAPKTISAVLNQHLKVSFNDFVNGYRIEAFKAKFGKPESKQFTIIGLALQCGFSSQATFQRVFKQSTGLSPSTFKNSMH